MNTDKRGKKEAWRVYRKEKKCMKQGITYKKEQQKKTKTKTKQ